MISYALNLQVAFTKNLKKNRASSRQLLLKFWIVKKHLGGNVDLYSEQYLRSLNIFV